MACTHDNIAKGVSRSHGLVCAAWVIAAAGTTQAIAQSKDPFDAKNASSEQDQVRVSEHMTVDLHVNDEDLINVLQMLSIQSERNIVASNKVSATVSADLYNVTFYEALDAILNVNGYGYVEKGNFIYVYTLEEIQQLQDAERRPIARVFRLNYLNANDAAEFVTPLLSESGQIKTNGDVDTFTIPDDAPMGDEQFALEATLVVVDFPENVEEIAKLVEQLDTKPQQVLVEATILRTKINEGNAFGVDFSVIGDLNFTDFINTGGPLSVANALQMGGSGATDEGFSPSNNHALGLSSTPGSTDKPGTFKLGFVQDDISVFLRLLDEVTDFTVLSNPKVLAINRQPARVLVGAKIGFLNTTATSTSTTQTVEFLDTGTQLAFRPFISKDGFVRMELRPSVSEGVIRQATGGNGASVSIPDEITQEVTTNVIVRDGSTIVLGGLFKESTTITSKQVPFVGDIPIIGAAFQGQDDATERDEIIFLITPTIMNDNILLDEGRIARDYTDAVRSGARRQLLPFSRDRMTASLNVEAERLAASGDTEKAIWKLRRSLELDAHQPEALRLRERLIGEKDREPSRNILRRVIEEAVEQRGDAAMLSPSAPAQSTPNETSDATPDQAPASTQVVPAAHQRDEAPSDAQSAPPAQAGADADEPLDFTFDWPEANTGLGQFDAQDVQPTEVAPLGDDQQNPGADNPVHQLNPEPDDAPAPQDESSPGADAGFMSFPSQMAPAQAPAQPATPQQSPTEAGAKATSAPETPAPAMSLLDSLIRRAAKQSMRKSDPSAPKGAPALSPEATAEQALSAPAAVQPAPTPLPAASSAPKPVAPEPSPSDDESKQPGGSGSFIRSQHTPAGGAISHSAHPALPATPVANALSRNESLATSSTPSKTTAGNGQNPQFLLPTLDPGDLDIGPSPDAPTLSHLTTPMKSTPPPTFQSPNRARQAFLPGDSRITTTLTRTGRSAVEPPTYFDPFTHLPNDPFEWNKSLADVPAQAAERRARMQLVSPWEVKSFPSQWQGPSWIFDPMFPYLTWSLAPGAPFFLPADDAQWPAALIKPGLYPTLKGTWKQVQGPLQDPSQRDDIEESHTSARLTEVGPEENDDDNDR